MTPPWADAEPLPGCSVVRAGTPSTTPAVRPRPKRAVATHPLVAKLTAANRFLDREARSLHPTAALIWMLLWRDEKAGRARTAVTDLSRRCGRSERTVKRALKELRYRGLLETVTGGSEAAGPTVHRLSPGGIETSKAGVTDGPP